MPINTILNWGPITLLNYNYKYLAERCKKQLPGIMNQEHTGFVPGRVIGTQTIKTQTVIELCKEERLKRLLLCIDLGFPPKSIEWNKIFYNVIQTCTINNGHISQFFKPTQGVRQGFPLSPIIVIVH